MKDFTFNIVIRLDALLKRYQTNDIQQVHILIEKFYNAAMHVDGDYLLISQIDLIYYPQIVYKKVKFLFDKGRIIKISQKEKNNIDNL